MGVNTRNRQDSTYLNYLTRVINTGGSYESVPLYQYKDQYDKLMIFNPTLLFYPTSQSGSTLYSVVPNDSGSNFTISRNSIGTYFDRNGRVQIAPNNTPRFDWDPSTGEYKGVLVEPAFQNTFTNNNSALPIAQAGGSAYSTPIRLDNEFGNGVNGFYMSHTSGLFLGAGYTLGNAQFSVASGSSLFYSCIIKNPSFDSYGLNIPLLAQVYFRFSTLQSRNVGDSSNVTSHSIKQIGNNTYLLSCNFIAPSGVQFFQNRQGLIFDYNSPNSGVVDGNFIIGLPTLVISNNTLPNNISLIPTTGSAVTKQADNITYNISSNINPNAGTLYCEFFYTPSGQFQRIVVLHNGFNNRIDAYINPTRTLSADSVKFGINPGTFFSGVVLPGRNKLIISYNNDVGNVRYYLNGSLTMNSNFTNLEPWSLNTLHLGRSVGGDQHLNGYIISFSYYNYVLSDEQAQFLTTL